MQQEIKIDTDERTANCGDVLEAREASAQSRITYESSDPKIASIDPETGEITVHKAGEVTDHTPGRTDRYIRSGRSGV